MANKVTENEEAPEAPVVEPPDGPLLDLSDAAVKKMIKSAKKRGFVTYDELNAVMPSQEVGSEQIEDVLAMLSEMGINVIETDEVEEADEEEEEKEEGTEVAERPSSAVATKAAKEPTDRTDDPVRMYLREMGSVELLSREGEIAIAKRIEAGRETMIGGLCESPLTFKAIITWHDQLKAGRMLLRDIVDRTRATVVFASHDLNWAAAYSDRIIVMDDGAIAADLPPAQLMQPAVVRRLFGYDAEAVVVNGRPLLVPRT